MPSEITDIKQFLEIARRKDAKGAYAVTPVLVSLFLSERDTRDACFAKTEGDMEYGKRYADTPAIRLGARLKKSSKSKDIKMKIRCKRYLYTLILKDSAKADKIKQSLPPSKFPCLEQPPEIFSPWSYSIELAGRVEKRNRKRRTAEIHG